MRFVVPLLSLPFSLPLAFGLLGALPLAAQTVIPAGVPLRIQIDHRYRVHSGTRIEGHLITPIYSVDHKVLPVNTQVTGSIIGTHPASQESRFREILDGQFFPPSVPDVRFTALRLLNGTTEPIQATVVQRDATVVKMSASRKHSSLAAKARQQIEDRKREAIDTIHHPNIGDRIEKWVYAQLPWSPPTIWTGTQYDADLTAPLDIPGPIPAALPQADVHGTPTGVLDARLTVDLDSAKDKHGATVTAVLTRPLLTPDGKQVLFPEGAKIEGLVTLAQPARWWARNGRLRFTFRSIEVAGARPATVHGQLAAAEAGSQENLKINEEGTAASSSGPGKYLAPMALGVLTAASYGDDAANPGNSAVISNGFGFAARIVAMSSANAAVGRGFAYFALSKSLYYRWIAKGKEIRFPKDTQIEILLNER
jgi:hypothetical protein